MDKGECERFLGPSSVFVLCSENEDGSTNAVPFSWVMLASYKPPLVVFFSKLSGTRTLENFRRTGEILICRPRGNRDLAQKLVLTTQKTIPREANKAEYVGLELAEVEGTRIRRVAQCTMWARGEYKAEFPVGDHILVVCELKEVNFPGGKEDMSGGLLYCFGKTFATVGEVWEVPGY